MAREKEDITAIMGYAKKYEKKIILQLLNSMDIFNDVNPIYNLSSTYVLPKYVANGGFRPEDITITEQDGSAGSFSTRSITPKVGMKILQIRPQEYRNTYFSDQMKPNAKEIPFSEYFWTAHNAKLASEVNDNSYFGEDTDAIPAYSSGSTYAVGARVKHSDKNFYIATASVSTGETPTTTPGKWLLANNSSVAKGFGTIIAQDINLFPSANKVVTGALNSTDCHDQVNAVYGAIPEVVKKVGGLIYCSINAGELYRQATNTKFNDATYVATNRGNVSPYIFGSNDKWQLKPVSWMAGSSRLIAVPDPAKIPNLFVGTNALSDFNTIGEEVKTLHGYDTIMKMSLSFQIADLSNCWINDQK